MMNDIIIIRSEHNKTPLLVPVLLIGALALLRNAVAWPGLTKDLVELVDRGVTGSAQRIVGLAKVADSAEIDAVFGPKAGSQINEAHGLLVRGANGLLDIDRDAPCIFLLGGQRLYDLGMPAGHTALMLERQLRGELRVPVEVPALPTVNNYSTQQ